MMQKKYKQRQLHYRTSSLQNYEPNKTQSWRSRVSKFSKHQILSSLGQPQKQNSLEISEQEIQRNNENRLINDLQNSFEIVSNDNNQKPLIGEQAIKQFYQHYKKLPKILDRDKYEKTSSSVYSKILNKCDQRGVLPLKFGILKEKGTENHINIQQSLYGKKYMQVFFEGSQNMSVTSCNFNATRFSEYSKWKQPEISRPLLKDIEILKLQKNYISSSCIKSVNHLIEGTSKLMQLDLGNNKLNDNGVIHLCSVLQINSRIRTLNLSRNGLTQKCVKSIIDINKNNGLQQLYLQWNKINGAGGKEIIDMVLDQQRISALKVLDLSWNLLGNHSGLNESLIKLFNENKDELYHLNISFNFFTQQQSNKLGEQLKHNKTIYGFHFQGHYGYIDSRGFLKGCNQKYSKDIKTNPSLKKLVKDRFQTQTSILPIMKKQLFGSKDKPLPTQQNSEALKNICWLCEKWIQHQFTLEIEDPQQQYLNKNIWIHFSFDSFQGLLIGQKTSSHKITYTCMIPPQRFSFFWTVGEDQQISSRYQIVLLKENCRVMKIRIGDQLLNVFVDKINLYQSPNRGSFNSRDIFPQNVKPRISFQQLTPNSNSSRSNFLQQILSIQTDSQLQSNFNKQWSVFKIQSILTQQQIRLTKSTFFQNYLSLKEIFKHYSCNSEMALDYIVMDTKSVVKLLSDHDIIQEQFDEDKIKVILSDILKPSFKQHQTGITIAMMMDLICRIVKIKYDGLDLVEGLGLVFETLKMNQGVFDDFNRWRDRVLFLQGLHKQLKKYQKRIQILFKTLTKNSNSDCISFSTFYKYLTKKTYYNVKLQTLHIKRAVFYSLHRLFPNQKGVVQCNLFFSQFVQAIARLAFIDENGQIIQQYSYSSRKQRLQKMIDFILSKEI